MVPPEQLVARIRQEARPGIWSTGVGLARSGAVVVESSTAQEVVLRVKAPGRPVPFTAVLYPQDEAWECDCPGRVDPCEHVVAAAIAHQQSGGERPALAPAAQRWSRVVYRFSRGAGGLLLTRTLAGPDGAERPLEGTLQALLARPGEAAKLMVENADLVADRLLERPVRGPLPPERLENLLKVLEGARNVLLEGRPVAVAAEPIAPQALVEDEHEQVKVTLRPDPRVRQVVSPGVALGEDSLHRLAAVDVTGPWLNRLPQVSLYRPEQLAEVAARVLPELAKRFPLEVRSRRLPPIDRELRPRIQLQLTQVDGGLSVLPTLVYGAPPSVRIDQGKMVYLQGAVPLRDEAAEQREVHRLREALDLIPGRRTTAHGPEAGRLIEKLRRWQGGLSGDGTRMLSPELQLRPQLRLEGATGPDGQMGLQGDLTFAVEGARTPVAPVAADAVLRAWREGIAILPLEGGGWASLPQAWLDRHGERLAQLLAARDERGHIANHAAPALEALCEALEAPKPPELTRLAALVEGFERLPEAPLPPDLAATLRPYQRQGVSWLAFLRQAGLGGILADDMGLGKTLQAICALRPRSLVVCPTSVLPNWGAELARFRPGLKVASYHGPQRSLSTDADVTLTTYALLRLDAQELAAVDWDTVVLDEGQLIKNPDSQVARAALKLKAGFKLVLTGTPLENRLEELWTLMQFANPGLLEARRSFDEHWARPIAGGNAQVAQRLRGRIRPFVLRRLKREVAPELPPRTESTLVVSLDEHERAVYDTVFQATRAQVVGLLEKPGSVLQALEALLRLRQAACHAALVPGQVASSSSKVQVLVDAIGQAAAEGHKALVFSQWTSLLDLIGPELERAGIAFERLDGSTVDRAGVTARFQAADGPPAILISLRAGGTGLNLTAADHVFLVDPWWNPAVEAQAADRVHRIGQERPVFVYRLIAQGTVEERILELQEKKRALFETAFSGAAGAATLSRDDLLALLS